MEGRAQFLGAAVLIVIWLSSSAAGCVFMLDADGVTGHPCDGDRERCLPGYSCHDGVCVEDPSTGVILCDGSCPSGQKCDWRIGQCVDVCAATVCPAGTVCGHDGSCQPISSGIGAPCEVDADCAGAIPGCSTDPDNPGRVQCACFEAVNDTGGVCLGIPSMADDCDACGESICTQVEFSYSGTTWMCVPPGFRSCEQGQAHCADPDTEAHCTFFGWPDDPGAFLPGEPGSAMRPLGLMPACAPKPDGAGLEAGEECDPESAEECVSGLCESAGDVYVCTHPCKRDSLCREVADGRCVPAAIDVVLGAGRMFEVANVCGSAPTLGRTCGSEGDDPACGTDAPVCVLGDDNRGACTRPCRDDGDCSVAQGFMCHEGRFLCH